MSDRKNIIVDDNNEVFNTENMFYKEFPSDIRQVRYFTLLIVQKAPPKIKEINLLEQQISEIIKNAVKHGNKCDLTKKVRVWYLFNDNEAKVVVEDEGPGFQKIAEWNEFNKIRQECLEENDFEKMTEYVSYSTAESDENDGGNAMFAALEYWSGGVVYTEKANKIGVKKLFHKEDAAYRLS